MSYKASNKFTVTYPNGKVYSEECDLESREAFLMSRFGKTLEEADEMGIEVSMEQGGPAEGEPEQQNLLEELPEGAPQGTPQADGSEGQEQQ